MDVRLSAEQLALRSTAAQVVDRFGPHAVGELDDDIRRGKLESAVASAGWRELRMDDGEGRPLATGVEVAIIAEQLGRGLADVAYLGPVLASELRRRGGAPDALVAEAVVFDASLSDLSVIDEPARRAGALAVDVLGAGGALVLTSQGEKYGLVIAGVRGGDVSADLTRRIVGVDGTDEIRPLDSHHLLSADDVMSSVALGLVVTCADLVGVMRGANQLTCEYAAAREQYGSPIGSFQAVQHLLADAHVLAEGSASVTQHAAWAVDALEPHEALVAAATAKAYCSRAGRDVCETAIQVHGGMGNTWECLAHVFLRRALLSADLFGGVGANLERVLRHHGIHADQTGAIDGLR